MMFDSKNWILAVILSTVLIIILILLSKYYAKYAHSHINDVKDLAKYHDKYQLYFLILGVFFPTSETLIEIFHVREESQLLYYIIVGIFCMSIVIISRYVNVVRYNLHKIFVGFFIILTLLLFNNLINNSTNLVNIIEFTMFVIFSYYAFYNIKHFYSYLLITFIFLLVLLFSNSISTKIFILYFNSCFVAYVFNYAKHITDLNIRENLLFTYNFVNKGALLVVGVSKRGEIVFVSENVKTILGFDKDQLTGKNWQNEIKSMIKIENSEEVGKTVYLQKIILNDENHVLIEWQEEPLYKDLAIKIGRDVTESRKAKVELQRMKEILEQTNRVAKIGGWEYDLIEQKGYSSEITKEIFGVVQNSEYNFQEAINYFEEGEHRNKITQALENCIKYGTPYDYELQIITAKEKKLWVRAKGAAEFVNNQCIRLYGTVQDIDERVKLNQLIKDREYQLRTLISNISSVTFRCLDDEKWTMIFISDAIQSLTGYPPSDFIFSHKRNYSSIVYKDDRDYVNSHAGYYSLEEYIIEYRIVDINNNIIWVNEKGRRYFDENEKRFLLDGIITNITERRQSDLALKQSYEDLKNTQTQLLAVQIEQEKFVNLVKNSDAFIAMANMNGEVFFLNEKAKLMSGYGESFHHTMATDYHSKEASKLLINVIIPEVLKNGMWRGEHDILNSKTKEVRFTESTMFTVKDPITEENIAIATVQIDITDRKNAEAQLIENQRVLVYKSKILDAIAKITEKLLISTNIAQTLHESFTLIGEATDVDRVYYFENDLHTNLINHKVEWVRDSISPQIDNIATKNLTFEDIYFYLKPLLQNKIFQKTLSEVTDQKLIKRWADQQILSVLLFPIFIKNTFYGFIGFDDCTNEQLWSDDKLNILQSLATNIANAIERINNESVIKESENNFRQLTETIEDVFMLYDMIHRKCIYVSPSCIGVLGVEPMYFYTINNYINDYLVEEDKKIGYNILDKIQKNNAAEAEYRIKTHDGQIKWIYQKSFGIRNEKNELLRISAIFTDITEKKLSQNEIKQLSLVAEKITNGVLITDTVGKVLWANQAVLEMMEIPLEQLLGHRPRDLFNPKSKDFEENYVIMDNYNYILEVDVLTYKKNRKWVQINNTAINDSAGNPIQQIEVIIDITKRKKTEKELKESERKLSSILNALDEVVWAISMPEKKSLFVSKSFEKVFDTTPNEWMKDFEIWKTILHPADKEIGKKIERDILKYGIAHEIFRIIDKNGHLKWLENTTKIVKNDSNEPFMIIGIIIDITDKKIAEEELIKAHQQADTANKSKVELELRTLQMQMNPHFVFNALNSIQSYIISHDTLTANNYLSKFAHLIRLFLDSSRSKFISLNEEIRLLTLYIELEKLRFDDKFDFEILLDSHVSKYIELPTMILQPFVENAINHGLRYKKEKGFLSIKFYLDTNYIICKIEDNGVGRKNAGKIQKESNKGYESQGLKITAERLLTYNQINDANIVFSINDKIINPQNLDDEVGTVIEIKFPEN